MTLEAIRPFGFDFVDVTMPRLQPEAALPTDKHFILFPQKIWNSDMSMRHLRENITLIPRLDSYTHDALHDTLSIVPPLDRHMARLALTRYSGVAGDPLESIDRLTRAIDWARDFSRTELEYDLGALVIRAITLQKPYIEAGLQK